MKGRSSTVGVFDKEWGKVLLLFSGVHFDAKNPLKWLVYFSKLDSNLSFYSKGRIKGIFLPL